MKSKLIALIFIIILLTSANLIFAAQLLTSDQLNELNEIESKTQGETEFACGRQCLIDSGWDPDSGWEPNANTSVACNLKCSPDPCTVSCSAQFSTFNEIDECTSQCVRPKIQACEDECSQYENASDNWYLQRCTCICKSGYIPGEKDCVLDDGTSGVVPDEPSGFEFSVPTVEELEYLFSDDELFPEEPELPEMDDFTKKKIKSWLGIDVDDYSPGSGNGKKAYIILNETLSPNKVEILYVYKKMQYMTAFLNHLGYDLRVVNRENSDAVFRAISDPRAGAVAYFGHADSPSIESQDFEGGADLSVAQARKQWYMEQGMNEREALRKANSEDTVGLDFYYNHTCHSADPGFEDLANMLIRPGGVYYGEPGLLWATTGPGTQYIKR